MKRTTSYPRPLLVALTLGFWVIALSVSPQRAAAQQSSADGLPRVVVLATGGTIRLVADWTEVHDDTCLVLSSGAIGSPAIDGGLAKRAMAVFPKLPELKRRVRALERRLDEVAPKDD